MREPYLRARQAFVRNTPRRSRKDIEAHYDLGDDLFERMLDPSMMYSCALFERPGMTLEQASMAKLELIYDKLDLQPTDHLLEIGTGWGSLALQRRPLARLPRDHDDDLQGPARDRRAARARGRARGPRDGAAGGLPRPRAAATTSSSRSR